MTQYSLPMPGSTLGDAGPYAVGGAAGLGWWDKWYIEARAGGRLALTAMAGLGVFYSVDGQLECTAAADTTSIDVDEGASMVDGIMHHNDTDPVNVPIPAAGAGDDRIDLVVVRKNYSAVATYTPGGGAPTVPFRETRITVIRGTEAVGPVAPTVTQDVTRATYWDIPLCSVQVDDAGALTLLTDLREYVDAETKILWANAPIGYNGTDVANITLDPEAYALAPVVMGIELPDNKDAVALGAFVVPSDYIDDMTIRGVLYNGSSSGNVYGGISVLHGACGEDIGEHAATPGGLSAEALTAIDRECLHSLSLPAATVGDMVNCQYERNAINVADTVGDSVFVLGFRVEYLGWK